MKEKNNNRRLEISVRLNYFAMEQEKLGRIPYQHNTISICHFTSRHKEWVLVSVFVNLTRKEKSTVKELYQKKKGENQRRDYDRKQKHTILLSPVMLDSSRAREWPAISTPSAGT